MFQQDELSYLVHSAYVNSSPSAISGSRKINVVVNSWGNWMGKKPDVGNLALSHQQIIKKG